MGVNSDSITYRLLGSLSFLVSSWQFIYDSPPLLQWPLGQPIISGLLSKYFYETGKYFYLIMFLFVVLLMTRLTKKHFGKYFVVGITYFIFMPNNYELNSLLLVKLHICFYFWTIYFLDKNNYKLAFLFFSRFFVRQSQWLIYSSSTCLYFIKRSIFLKYIFILLVICLLVMSYNFLYNDAFLISTTISTNIQGDGFNQSNSNLEYSFSIFQNENLHNVFNIYLDFMEKVHGIAYLITVSYIIHSLTLMELFQIN